MKHNQLEESSVESIPMTRVVMWSETVGLGQDRSETKKFGLGLAH